VKKFAIAGWVVALLAGASLLAGQDSPEAGLKKIGRTSGRQWLQQFVGEWGSEIEARPSLARRAAKRYSSGLMPAARISSI